MYLIHNRWFLVFQETFTPAKFFSIDRVFRNETLDATHLAEFHQIEGLVADRNITLGDLIGTLYEFFKKLGKLLLSWHKTGLTGLNTCYGSSENLIKYDMFVIMFDGNGSQFDLGNVLVAAATFLHWWREGIKRAPLTFTNNSEFQMKQKHRG